MDPGMCFFYSVSHCHEGGNNSPPLERTGTKTEVSFSSFSLVLFLFSSAYSPLFEPPPEPGHGRRRRRLRRRVRFRLRRDFLRGQPHPGGRGVAGGDTPDDEADEAGGVARTLPNAAADAAPKRSSAAAVTWFWGRLKERCVR